MDERRVRNSFDGKVAIVTGAASGIGRSCAQLYAREGAKVVVSDVDEKGGQETVRLIKEAGGEAVFYSRCGSRRGRWAFAGSPAYVAAKHGLIGSTKNAALEYAAQGIRVNLRSSLAGTSFRTHSA